MADSNSVDVTWNPPADNGGAYVTGYKVVTFRGDTKLPDTYSRTTATDYTCRITGLPLGSSYRFQVTATNTVGTSAASASPAHLLRTDRDADPDAHRRRHTHP